MSVLCILLIHIIVSKYFSNFMSQLIHASLQQDIPRGLINFNSDILIYDSLIRLVNARIGVHVVLTDQKLF